MAMQAMARGVIVFIAVALMSACAPMVSGVMNASIDDQAVHEKTAKHFGVSRENVAISSIEKGALSTAYQARVTGRLYNCTIYYGEVKCAQPGGSAPSSPAAERASSSQDQRPSAVTAVQPSMTPAQAQTRLNELGFSVGTADGILGRRSVEQLKRFQESRGIAVTGKLDDATIEALR